jgi:hypothetical protein
MVNANAIEREKASDEENIINKERADEKDIDTRACIDNTTGGLVSQRESKRRKFETQCQ